MKNVIPKTSASSSKAMSSWLGEPVGLKHAALEVIEFCMAESIAVLGGEVGAN